jgi:hypothetical protein
MKVLSKWIRVIHRWLSVPLMFIVTAALIGSATGGGELPAWIGLLGLLTLLSLLITGLVMFVQHYWRRLRRGRLSSA